MNKNIDGFTPAIDPLQLSEDELKSRARALEVLLDEEKGSKKKMTFSGRPGRFVAVAHSALAVSAGVATAAGFFSANDVAVGAGIGCYSEASLEADTFLMGARANPVEACAKMWDKYGVEAGFPTRPAELTACSGKGAPVMVFPSGAGVCKELGLQPLPDGYNKMAAASERVSRSISRVNISIEGERCASPQVVARKVRRNLRADRIAGIKVVVTGGNPCVLDAMVAPGNDSEQVNVLTISRKLANAHFLGIG